jgi:hypothetical protein
MVPKQSFSPGIVSSGLSLRSYMLDGVAISGAGSAASGTMKAAPT